MTYTTIEANIANGQIVPKESAQPPERGLALVTIMSGAPRHTNWETVESVLGILNRPSLDSSAWQRQIRSDWDRD